MKLPRKLTTNGLKRCAETTKRPLGKNYLDVNKRIESEFASDGKDEERHFSGLKRLL